MLNCMYCMNNITIYRRVESIGCWSTSVLQCLCERIQPIMVYYNKEHLSGRAKSNRPILTAACISVRTNRERADYFYCKQLHMKAAVNVID